MKYLVTAYDLGMLVEAEDKDRRAEIVKFIISLKYITGTDDTQSLEDHCKINKLKRSLK